MRLTAAAGGLIRVQVDANPDGKNRKLGVYLAFAEDGGASNVPRGENRGRTLHHVAIARDLRPLGSLTERSGFAGEVPLPVAAAVPARRVIAFVQDTGNGRVWGAARISPPVPSRLVP